MTPSLRRVAFITALVVVTAAIAFMAGRSRRPATAGSAVSAASTNAAAPTAASPERVRLSTEALAQGGITIVPARAADRTDSLDASAVLAIDETRTARVGSVVEGTVTATLAEVGDRVRSGTLLAELHSHVVHDTWADYRRAIAERRRLETELTFARDAEARAERLLKDKAISTQERERAAANRAAAEEQLDMAITEVRRSEEALEHLGITNKEDPSGETGERIPARAPLGGVVLERNVTTGTAVTPGTPLFVISDLGALWALAEFDERHLSDLRVDRSATLTVAAFPDQPFPATVAFVGDTVNPKTRRVVVRCAVPNPGGLLKPGMFATVVVQAGEPRRAIEVPSAAVQDVDGRPVVFVEQSTGVFSRREVVPGAVVNGWTEIVRGLREGERVAGTGSFLIKSELLKSQMADEG